MYRVKKTWRRARAARRRRRRRRTKGEKGKAKRKDGKAKERTMAWREGERKHEREKERGFVEYKRRMSICGGGGGPDQLLRPVLYEHATKKEAKRLQ
jgi:hypothetical protein